jgi:hypothetical protein
MKPIGPLAIAGAVFVLTSCHSRTSSPTGPGVSSSMVADAGYQLPYVIATAATAGCRSNRDPGCEVCCRQLANGLREQCDSLMCNANKTGTCASGQPTCAKCSTIDERDLVFAGSRIKECECGALQVRYPDLDSCWNRESCACVCGIWGRASTQCPPANPPLPVTLAPLVR